MTDEFKRLGTLAAEQECIVGHYGASYWGGGR